MASENKTKATAVSGDDFIDAVPDPVRRADAKVVADIMTRVSGERAKMWGPSIVGYGRYHYKYESGREGDMPRLGFSPRKAELVLYLVDGSSAQAELLAKLGKHRTGKSCLYIKKLADVDMAVLDQMIVASWEETARRYPV